MKILTPEEREKDWQRYKHLQKQIEEEQRCNFLCMLDEGIDTFEFELIGDRTMEEIYRDMSPHHSQFFDRTCSATYLFLGIQRMDSWMSDQIQLRESCEFSPETLAKMIRYNYHLHNVIKTNLLDNLKHYSGYDGFNILKKVNSDV